MIVFEEPGVAKNQFAKLDPEPANTPFIFTESSFILLMIFSIICFNGLKLDNIDFQCIYN